MLPFHLLIELQQIMYPGTYKNKVNEFERKIVIPVWFYNLQDKFEKITTFSPISIQGLMLFGAIASTYRITFS